MRNRSRPEHKRVIAKFDGRDGRPGAKFCENERKGVCLRIGIGPRDLKNEVVEYKRRDQDGKQSVSMNGFVDFAKAELEEMQTSLFETAKKRVRQYGSSRQL